MSSNIQVQRICEHCGSEFTARTTVTRFCGDVCAKRAYKVRLKNQKVQRSNEETKAVIQKPIQELNSKQILTAKEVASLLNCSLRTVYYQIESGNIKAVNFGQRLTRIRRSEIERVFDQKEGGYSNDN